MRINTLNELSYDVLLIYSNVYLFFFAVKIGNNPDIAKHFCRYIQSTMPKALATAFLMKALMVIPSLLAAIAAPL